MHFQRLLATVAVAVSLFFLPGCGDEERPKPKPVVPVSFHPEQFPDIPVPVGYGFALGQDQLAITLAGGLVRRFEVTLERRDNAPPQNPAEALTEVKRLLPTTGWQLIAADDSTQRWSKSAELLVVETGRAASRTTIQFRLRPLVAQASAR